MRGSELQAALDDFVEHCINHRPHLGLGEFPSMFEDRSQATELEMAVLHSETANFMENLSWRDLLSQCLPRHGSKKYIAPPKLTRRWQVFRLVVLSQLSKETGIAG